MMSQHRNTALVAHNAVQEDTILDATYELLLAVGVRRMTMADIARQSGVSRATLYRRWQNVGEVVATLMTREWSAVAAQSTSTARRGRDRVVETVVTMTQAIRNHPLLRKIIEVDPEVLLPYLLQRRGTSTNNQLELLEEGIREGIRDLTIRRGPVEPRAQAILLTAWSFVLTGPVLTDDHATLDTELRDMLTRYLK